MRNSGGEPNNFNKPSRDSDACSSWRATGFKLRVLELEKIEFECRTHTAIYWPVTLSMYLNLSVAHFPIFCKMGTMAIFYSNRVVLEI